MLLLSSFLIYGILIREWGERMNIDILREVGMISRCIHSICDIRYKEIGLEKGQFLFVVRVLENPGINQETLSELLKVDKTTVAKALKKLSEKGYINKKRSEHDGRAFELYPTEKAEEVKAFLMDIEYDVNRDALAGLSDDEQASLYEQLKTMRLKIEETWQDVRRNRKTKDD